MTAQAFVALPTGARAVVDVSQNTTAGAICAELQAHGRAPIGCRIHDGMRVLQSSSVIVPGSRLTVSVPLRGGKGGYGNQLRALGRKGGITDNTGDCRDLSGRRLRDVEAAQQLAEWQAGQRERDAAKAQARKEAEEAKAQQRELEAQEIQEEVVQLARRKAANVGPSVSAGMSSAVKLQQERKRVLELRHAAASKRSKVFALSEDEDDRTSDDTSDDEQGANNTSETEAKSNQTKPEADGAPSASCA